jgi:ribosome recycling factor
MEELYTDAERRMRHAIDAMLHDFSTIRTGRATPALLERITVEYYGADTPLSQVSNITVTDARTLTISPYEKNLLGPIEKAIMKSDLGINPNNDGQNIRLIFPQMTEERRKELVKQVNARAETCVVAIRNVRRDANDHAKKAIKEQHLSEDDLKSFEAKVQKLTDKFVEETHALQKKKDTDLMEV